MLPKTHQVLYSFKPDKPRVPASLTKLGNALVMTSLPINWDRLVRLTSADEVGGGRLRVNTGAKMSMRDLLYSAITASANNAATALARLSGLSRRQFIARMDAAVKKVGATHTSYADPSGMDPRNLTTARDIALIAEAAFRQPMIRSAASSATYRFTVVNTGQKKVLTNTNHLLTQSPDVWVVGGKTGYLEESQYNLAVQVRPIDGNGNPVYGKDLIVVVMGSPYKEGVFQTARRLAMWAWENHEF